MATASTLVPQFPLLERWRAIGYGRAFVIAIVLLAGAVALLNALVDPFQQYRKPAWYEPHYYRTLQRHINPGLVKNSAYDTVITGSSMMENYRNVEAGEILHGNVLNVAMGAATAYELRQLLKTVLVTGKAKHIIFDVNFNAFSGSPKAQVVTEPLPLYLYDDMRWNDVHYLLQSQTLVKSLEIVFGLNRSRYATDADAPWYWADEYAFSKDAVLRGLDLSNINRDFRQPQRTLEGMLASFEINLLPLFRAHPEVRFSLVYPPYSSLVWKDFQQRGQVEVTLAFKRAVFAAVRDLPNVALYDFQARLEWVADLNNYKDIYHFSPRISRQMIEAIAEGTNRVDEKTVDESAGIVRTLALSATGKETSSDGESQRSDSKPAPR
ncbi:MAG: hypothetical protein ABI854_06530 [Betaproteobacteria bacterium]